MKKTLAVLVMVIMAVGFEWSLPQGTKDAFQITFKNQFSFDVSFYVNGYFVCSAKANSSCKAPVKIGKGSFKVEARGGPLNKVMASETFDPLVPGEDIIWETGNVERNSAAPPAAAAQPTIETPPAKPTAPAPPAAQSKPAAPASSQVPPKDITTTYMKSTTTLSYKGTAAQNRVRTASLQKIERRNTAGGTVYDLSDDNAVLVGKNIKPAFYAVAPSQLNRDVSGHLTSDQNGLKPWLDTVNSTLDGLAHKRMTSGAWQETLRLPSGALGPSSVDVNFRANALPKPDDKWLLITAETKLMSFNAATEIQDSPVYGRYQGVLVYSPAEDLLLQSAAVFTSYLGEDQLRIEQVHFSADANGNQLIPALNVTNYLNISRAEQPITAEGAIPAWCLQTAHVFDFLHVAIMTAAEGATNPSHKIMKQAASNIHNQSYATAQKVLSDKVAKDFMGRWYAQQMRIMNNPDWNFWLRDVVTLDLSKNFGPGQFPWASDLNKPLYVSAVKMINGKLYDIGLINDFLAAPQVQAAEPVRPAKPATPQPPPDKVKKAPASAGGDSLLWLEAAAGLLGLVAGAYELGLFGGGGGDVDCKTWYDTVRFPMSKEICEWMHPVSDPYIFSVPLECGCPYPTKETGSRYTENGVKMMTCVGCYTSF
ncbi:MAG: hypothetical protein MUP52_15015 [Candidatus Aminicenantes bacterium]|nr:hypothetical protein [Candidatus Aminicenantes bacterium]